MVQIARFSSAIKLTRDNLKISYCVRFMKEIKSNFKFMIVVKISLMHDRAEKQGNLQHFFTYLRFVNENFNPNQK